LTAIAAASGVELGLRDTTGATWYGSPEGKDVTRPASESLPLTIDAASLNPPREARDFAVRRRLLVTGLVVIVGMAIAASYLIARAVNREMAVARLQSDFVATVSHEFRTPLTSLRQFTDMLRENPALSDERRRIAYDAQSRATDRLLRLVESLLDFGRMQAGARRYHFEPRDCTDLVGAVVNDFRREAEASGHPIEFRGNGTVALSVDDEALSRAVRNLLENAVKYSPDPNPIEVAVERRDPDVVISVTDRGIGIPPQERASIFSKFQRGEQARTRGIKGTGIGLAMVEEIVRAHRGRIEVASEVGRGSTFTIVLPQQLAGAGG
jgi:signal transduction histidine kinase